MKGLLFLCVGNSARSQMAEGIARSLAPDDIQIWSAGSKPAQVRPEAVTVLNEIGSHISSYRSKGVDAVPGREVDMVVTLCGEEECPLFLGQAKRLHWGLRDPAAVLGTSRPALTHFARHAMSSDAGSRCYSITDAAGEALHLLSEQPLNTVRRENHV